MPEVFLYGTLRHRPLLELVAGSAVSTRPATLPGYRTERAEGADFPVPVRDPQSAAPGLLCTLGEDAYARLDWYERIFDYAATAVEAVAEGETVGALAWLSEKGEADADGSLWALAEWEDAWAPMTVRAAREAMALYGHKSPSEIGSWKMYLGRADAALRAEQQGRPVIGTPISASDVRRESFEISHAGFFVMRTETLEHPSFAGGMSGPHTRETFAAGDSAIVLPYDPVRDRVLLVEQFRMGPWGRGARYPWMLEPVAGRVDPGETPETCAWRETEEEAGITLSDLVFVSSHYPSPGCVTEYFYTYVGLCDLPDDTATDRGGLDTEGEDIRTHILPFETAMEMVSGGEADNGPLVLLLLWLARERPRLRGMA